MSDLRIQLFADGADQDEMLRLYAHPLVRGFTTNPTLMRKANIAHYEEFAREVLQLIPDRPISFEVFSDEFEEMERQSLRIAGWGSNVFVKIPVTNSRGESTAPLVRRLSANGVKVNVTAVLSEAQIDEACEALCGSRGGYVSVFAGRIADTGRDPLPFVCRAVQLARKLKNVKVIWASPREVLNIFQADSAGCDVITMTGDLFKKLDSIGRALDDFSLDTVRMFRKDAVAAGYAL